MENEDILKTRGLKSLVCDIEFKTQSQSCSLMKTHTLLSPEVEKLTPRSGEGAGEWECGWAEVQKHRSTALL